MRDALGAGGSPSIDEGAVEVDDVDEIEVLLASDEEEKVIESLQRRIKSMLLVVTGIEVAWS